MSDLLKNLNLQQKEAVIHSGGPLLIVAGAGTGKTTVITSRVAWLINQKLAKPEEILALTFTERAASEMEERVDKLLPYGYVDLWISTFHSFCERILQQHALDIGLPNDFKLLDQTQQWLLVRQNLDKFNLNYYRPLGNPTKFIHALLKHFSRCKDEEIGPEEYLEYAEKLKLNLDGTITSQKSIKSKVHKVNNKKTTNENIEFNEVKRLEEVAGAYHVYQQLLLDNDSLDFGDLINYTLKLFRERPAVLQQYQEQFKYILIDEFQDTNWAQYELVKLLLNKQQNLTVVGDDDQSIYKFRGASVSNILNFIKDFPKSKKIVLTQNYRSIQDILDLSYNFIQLNNPNRLECAVVETGLKPVSTLVHDINKKLKSNQKGQAQIEHLQAKDLNGEVKLVINKIVELKNQPTLNPSKKGNSLVAWSDFAILVRANSTAIPFINALNQAGIPFVFYSMRGLYSKPIILDIMALFKLLDNYHESSALFRALNIPVFTINYKDFSKLTYQAKRRAESLFETLHKIDLFKEIDEKTRTNVKKLLALIDKYSKLAKEKSISELYIGLMKDSGYLKYLTSQETRVAQEQLSYLQQFYKKIQAFENKAIDPKLKYFMDEMNLEIDSGEEGSLSLDLDAGPDMVRIMTIHSAKGLEFKYVFVVGMVDKRFPTIERKEPIQIPDELVKEILPQGDIHLQEERRLFYVAMTRAKNGLFFSSAEDYGGVRKKKVSRFIGEINFHQNTKTPKHQNNDGEQPLPTLPIRGETSLSPLIGGARGGSATENKEVYLIPKHFSYSQLAAFEKCPLQYKYNFLLKIPIHGKDVFSFGKTMHGTLQKFFQKFLERQKNKQSSLFDGAVETGHCSVPTMDDLLQLYEESWIDEWYSSAEDKKKYKEKGKKILKDFYTQHQDNWPQVRELEKSFNLKIGNYTIRGVIDRIDEVSTTPSPSSKRRGNVPPPFKGGDGGGYVEIIDYKTGRVKEQDKLTLEDKEQLLLYQMAAEEVFKLNPVKLTFYYLDQNKPVSFLGTSAEKEKLKNKILGQIEQIKQSDFPPKPSQLCQFCDFKEICEYRQI
jgi:DNA helicase-2/ATP-dependent DNA helicase PcrA